MCNFLNRRLCALAFVFAAAAPLADGASAAEIALAAVQVNGARVGMKYTQVRRRLPEARYTGAAGQSSSSPAAKCPATCQFTAYSRNNRPHAANRTACTGGRVCETSCQASP